MTLLGPTWLDALACILGIAGLVYLVLWTACEASAEADEYTLLHSRPSPVAFDETHPRDWPVLASDERTAMLANASLLLGADQQNFRGRR
jgi:hypothetical protein